MKKTSKRVPQAGAPTPFRAVSAQLKELLGTLTHCILSSCMMINNKLCLCVCVCLFVCVQEQAEMMEETVELEMDELNQHECMATMTALLNHMQRNKITPTVEEVCA